MNQARRAANRWVHCGSPQLFVGGMPIAKDRNVRVRSETACTARAWLVYE